MAIDVGLPKLLVDWAQVAGAGIGVLALALSLYALWKSPRDIARERVRQFELDVLRDIGDLPRTSSLARPGSILGTKLLMLEDRDDEFGMTRSALKVRVSPSELGEFETRLSTWLTGRNHSGHGCMIA
jgi:hypothetical protein